MADYQITRVRKDGADPDRRIDRFSGPGWEAPIDDVIRWIDTGAHRFWTSVDGRSVWCMTGTHPTSKRKYVTTQGDSFPPNNLLKLPGF